MKKTLIALAITGLSFNAAAVDLTAPISGAVNFASEITLPATLADTASSDLDVKFELGFSATQAVKRYVRIDLTNAAFTATSIKPLNGILTESTGIPLAPVISVGGTAGSNYVVIEISPAENLANDSQLTLLLEDVRATGGNASVQYRLYETGVDAAAGNANILAGDSGKLFNFEQALLVKAAPMFSTIDVTQESKFFVNPAKPVGDADAEIGSLTVTAASGVLNKDGLAVKVADIVKAAKLVVTGDFSAGLKDENGLLNTAAVMDGHGTASASQYVTTRVIASQAEFAFNPVATPVTETESLVYFVDGKTAMNGAEFTATFTPVANTGYTVPATAQMALGHMNKNGSSATANFVLAHDTSYNNLVRISNTSGIAGKFFITVIADDGKSVNFPLSDVAGQPAALAAGASTEQMNVEAIYQAAVAKGYVGTPGKNNKMRIVVEGEVGSLSLQNYTISKDGNALNTMNAF